MKKLLALTLMVFLLTGVSAQAVLITSSANGVVFEDDFEGAVLGGVPDNGSLPGSWNVRGGATIYGALSDPGPVQGSQYVGLVYPDSNQVMSAILEGGAVSSGTLHMEWMAYIPAETDKLDLLIDNGRFGIISWVPDSETGIGEVRYHDGAFHSSGITYQTEKWQKWELDIDVSSQVYTLSVDGETSGLLPFRSAGGIGGFDFYCADTGVTWYMDAVPEPSTIVMLIAGLSGLLVLKLRRN